MKKAIISVNDKTGIIEFVKDLINLEFEIISTGGTASLLLKNNINVIEISKITGFPQILEGRVKTLHPKIHGGILAKREKKQHLEELKKFDIDPIDLVVVNLYPFEKTLSKYIEKKQTKIPEEIIENIDIGGVTLLRAAAKNFQDVLVVCDINDYKEVIELFKKGEIDYETRKKFAAKSFRHTAYYDSIISNYFTDEVFPENISIGIKKTAELRYGENPHQKAALYSLTNYQELSITKILQGKKLSFNNYLDLNSAINTAMEFENPACVIVKHNNPCGVAEGSSKEPLVEIYKKALFCDPVSAFGGIIAFNCELDSETAEEIIKIFTECIAAPKFSNNVMEIFSQKKNLRLLELNNMEEIKKQNIEYRTIFAGLLVQEKDMYLGLDNLKIVTEKQPTQQELISLKFAWKVAKNVKSNAIILVRGTQTVGIGAGQMSRIDALKIANIKMNNLKLTEQLKNLPLVLASDAFFPFQDVVNEAKKIGVSSIIQPGGSLNDKDSIDACNRANISMIFTGTRHFKH